MPENAWKMPWAHRPIVVGSLVGEGEVSGASKVSGWTPHLSIPQVYCDFALKIRNIYPGSPYALPALGDSRWQFHSNLRSYSASAKNGWAGLCLQFL
jgi:hypothetical protein